MRTEWQRKKLGEICELINGRAYRKPELLSEGKYRVLRVGNFFTNEHWYYSDMELEDRKYCEHGDLLYAWSASFGPHIWTGDKVIFHYHIWKVVPDTKHIDQRFLFYFLEWDKELLKLEEGAGTTMIHVSKGAMEERDIFFPSLLEQRYIVTVLDKALIAITAARANAEENRQNARILFEHYLQSIFSQSNEGWIEKSLGEMATFRNGVNFTKTSKGESIKILGVKDFKNHYWAQMDSLDSIIPDGILPEGDILQQNDIVFVRSNGNPELIGRCVLIGEVHERTTFSGFTIRARLFTKEVTPKYLCHFLKSSHIRRELVDGGNGANIRSLNQGALSRLRINFPEKISDQHQIIKQLEIMQAETQRLESLYQRKIDVLDELKQSLLHQAFSGKL